MTPVSSTEQRRAPRPLYACVTRELLLCPPIELSAYDLAIATSVCALAGVAREDQLHQSSLEGGLRSIDLEKQLGEEFRDAWKQVKAARRRGEHAEAPVRIHAYDYLHGRKKPKTKKREAIRKAGANGYQQTKHELRRAPMPATLTFSTTRKTLLRVVGLAANGASVKKVEEALEHLRQAVGDMPPLIESWKELRSGRLRLVVSTTWMEKPFGKLPVPLPSAHAPRAQALYLFLFSIRTTALNRETISLSSLCQRIGVATTWGPKHASRVVTSALERINQHLATLDHDALRGAGVKVPFEFELVGEDGRIRFAPVDEPRQPQGDEAEEDAEDGGPLCRRRRKFRRDEEDRDPCIDDTPWQVHEYEYLRRHGLLPE